MNDEVTQVEKGHCFVWQTDRYPDPVYCVVTRVARDGSWADLRCRGGSAAWTKRQPLPLSPGFRRVGRGAS
jgi:hypothetical protein